MRKDEKMLMYLRCHVLKSMLFIERSDFERGMRAAEWAKRRLIAMNQKEKDALWKKITKEDQ